MDYSDDTPDVTTTYDRQGRRIQVEDGSGTRTLTYNAAGQTLTETYTTDRRGNIISSTNAQGHTFTTVSGAQGSPLRTTVYTATASRVLTEELRNGGNTTRQFSYTYFATGANIGLLQTVTDPRGVTLTHSYDAFMRPTTVVATGSMPAQNMSRTYGYDLLGALNTITQTYTGTGVGATTTVERERDPYGDITKETVKINGTIQSQFTQQYDASRRRTGLHFTPAAQGQGAGRSYAFTHRPDGALASLATIGVPPHTFTYGMEGLLKIRNTPVFTQTITARDTVGRPLASTTSTGTTTILSESQTWQPDGRLTAYNATRAGTSTLDTQRNFTYNARGQLTQEETTNSTGADSAYAYRFDRESQPSGTGLGIRTLAQRTFPTSQPTDLEPGSWETKIAANPAADPRDAFGRPVHLAQRDAANDGFDFTAIYDGLGRRLRTVTHPTSGASPKVIDSYFDPLVEFLELGVAVDGNRIWKIYGPDMGGAYGTYQGIR
ncbi:MAG: hypothetical protein ACK5L6_09095, partial [Anaerorhabdus sp.]|uniref:hypothetical protein n=1 Tax=Anaerorhabdus sp. TaxID=1872524 RepID=UPI003A896C8F